MARTSLVEKSVYALKDTGADLNKNKHMYTDELLKEVKHILKVYNLFFGYASVGQRGGGLTEFFSYSEAELSAYQQE